MVRRGGVLARPRGRVGSSAGAELLRRRLLVSANARSVSSPGPERTCAPSANVTSRASTFPSITAPDSTCSLSEAESLPLVLPRTVMVLAEISAATEACRPMATPCLGAITLPCTLPSMMRCSPAVTSPLMVIVRPIEVSPRGSAESRRGMLLPMPPGRLLHRQGTGAGDGGRTRDLQLGKLTLYH